ncbi:adenylate/guanylate cyclase domain-containing protein [Thermodesulfobacteriota bacterium]
MECPDCHHQNPKDSKFCNECGYHFAKSDDITEPSPTMASERKHVTIMFSDMSGYTAMTERLDPEEVKKIMSEIFGKITAIIKSYDGFIERFIGDAVMAVFGIPKAHEDDPIRAIRAAMEIHAAVEDFSPQYEVKIGHPLTMHTGINTGLVVTGEVDVEKGIHGLTGDAINLASRLEGLANSGEIVVGPDTHQQALNYFEFDAMEPTKVKGKRQRIRTYRFTSVKSESFKTHRLQGLQAALTGRDKEMAILVEALQQLKQGTGSIISICGDAGTGKSRLKKEFKDALDSKTIEWHEGHAYGYTQSMPYYPLINLLTNAFQIDESDTTQNIRTKVETGVSFLLGADSSYIPYMGSLFSLTYPEIENVSPEFLKDKLWESVQALLTALVDKSPSVICFEDLHWADPSSIELFKQLVAKTHKNALFIITYRSHFTPFDNDLPGALEDNYQEIRLKELSSIDAQDMLKSLLHTKNMAEELHEIVQQKAEGNPFYIEEIINSLIDSHILTRDNGNWKLNRNITEGDVPATIQGVLTARVDRLGPHFKKILQEASVIGRAFLYKILERITDLDSEVNKYLDDLEGLDLIRTQSMEPDLEYIFKHALTQEVVYNGLLKKERQEIHERIGLAIEQLFADRLPEFYEAISFHFNQGFSQFKAAEYLMKAGEKSLKKYALEESHQYFNEAYNVFADKLDHSEKEKELLIDIQIKWAYVYYYRGDFRGLVQLFKRNERIAKSLINKEKQGFFLAWLGMALWMRERLRESELYLRAALKLGEEAKDQRLIGYACCWLSITCADLGLFDEALGLAEKGIEIAERLGSDHYLYFKSMHAKGLTYYYMGFCNENLQIGKALIDYGNKHSNSRCLVLGYMSLSFAHLVAGNPALALEAGKDAVKASADPIYSIIPNVLISFSYFQMGKFNKAAQIANEILVFHDKFGCEYHGTPASIILGGVMIAKGKMASGLKQIKEKLIRFKEIEKKSFIPTGDYILGKIYFQIATGEGSLGISVILKNVVFLVRTLPVARKRAEYHFNKAIDMANETGAKGIMGQAYFDLGLLYKSQKRKNQAKQCISKAIQVFKKTKAEVFLKQAELAMKSLD